MGLVPLVFALWEAAPSSAFADEIICPTNTCEYVNFDGDIFSGRLMSWGEKGARVRVIRVFRGSVSGEIDVWPAYPGLWLSLVEGKTYLFEATRTSKENGAPLAVGACDVRPLSSVPAEERAILSGTQQGPDTGRVYGTLTRSLGILHTEPLARVPIVLKGQSRQFSGLTGSDGKYEIPDLPPGSYRISVGLPPGLALQEEEDLRLPVKLMPYGCVNLDFWAVNDAVISGRVVLPSRHLRRGDQGFCRAGGREWWWRRPGRRRGQIRDPRTVPRGIYRGDQR